MPALLEIDGEIANAGFADGLDEGFRDAAKSEAPCHDHHAIVQQAGESRLGVGIDFLHALSPFGCADPAQRALGRGRANSLSCRHAACNMPPAMSRLERFLADTCLADTSLAAGGPSAASFAL